MKILGHEVLTPDELDNFIQRISDRVYRVEDKLICCQSDTHKQLKNLEKKINYIITMLIFLVILNMIGLGILVFII